jgi:uncharacterized membrane protein HdeD (DUF308 family)
MLIWMVNDSVKKQLTENIKQHKKLYIFNGCMFMILGVIAFMAPLVAAEFLDILIGCLLLLTGIVQAGLTVVSKRHWSYYFSAIISIFAGSLMVFFPRTGILALAAIIAIFLLLQGCMQIFSASMYAPFKGWSWMLTSGLISVILAALIYAGWPITAIWFLGVLVGINFISFGISMIVLTKYVTTI